MKKFFTYFVLLCFVLVFAGSCKELTIGTAYQLRVEWQERKSQLDSTIPLSTTKAYAFFVDPTKWEVLDIEDARNGIITMVADKSQKRNYDEAPTVTGKYTNVYDFVFDSAPVMLLVADTKQPMWATGDANIVPALPNMYVTLKFRPLEWTENSLNPIVKKPWKFYGYKNVVIPVDTKLNIVPAIWRAGEATSSILYNTGSYAFYGVTKKTKGKVASWDDARKGIAQTTIGGDTVVTKNYNVKGEWRNDSLLMKVDNPNVMVVVYGNQPEQSTGFNIYAYSFFDLSENKPEVRSDVLFSVRELQSDKDTVIVYNNWNVVYEKVKENRR